MVNNHSQYWTKVARKYDYVVDLQIGGTTRSLVRERVSREGSLGSSVEFGCGTGFNTAILSAKAERLVATDFSPGMLALTKERVKAPNVTFQIEDCQKTSFGDGTFDTAFMSLVIHFTEPLRTLTEMRRILKPGGNLIIVNLDPAALKPFDRLRCWVRIIVNGLARFRVKPPQGFGRHMLTDQQLSGGLRDAGFYLLSQETIRDESRSSNIPVEYVRARRFDS
jgi:ubiquinone/menaquinone biosynthesis C-methylase UbiE